jgi:hypothetical protein
MAIIDVVMLRTEDTVSRSFGSNLLQNLTGYFGMSASLSGSTSNQTSFVGSGPTSTNLSLGGSLGAGTALAYSLNIANATQNRNEVLARPTLLAIDRLPSTFSPVQTSRFWSADRLGRLLPWSINRSA